MNGSPLNKITKGLYISNLKAASDINLLKLHSITHILICGTELQILYPDHFICKKLEILDKKNSDIGSHLLEGIEFINQAISNSGNVLAYCKRGKSRSPTIVIGYLMKYHDLQFAYALERVKKLHPETAPINFFLRFLREFEDKLSMDKSNSCYCIIW